MSINRGTAPAALLVCRVERTKWPVKEALIAKESVSLSRISPTIIMSGSCLTSARKPVAKEKPIFGLT